MKNFYHEIYHVYGINEITEKIKCILSASNGDEESQVKSDQT